MFFIFIVKKLFKNVYTKRKKEIPRYYIPVIFCPYDSLPLFKKRCLREKKTIPQY